MSTCNTPQGCGADCNTYDLCKVTVKGGNCVPDGTNQIVCEGFKFSTKVDSEILTDCSCHEGYGYKVSDITYEWEITNPCDYDWFDRRIIGQICDKYSMEITGYVQTDCGEWEPKETLLACFIDETDRDYGKGVTRSLKGKALQRVLGNSRMDDRGNISNVSKAYKNNMGGIYSAGRSLDGKDSDLWTTLKEAGYNLGTVASSITPEGILYNSRKGNYSRLESDVNNWWNDTWRYMDRYYI